MVQRKWIYLEGIFVGAEDIRMQLPEEAKKFDVIDKLFKGIMSVVSKNPNVIDACVNDGRLEMLTALSERLDGCQKSLSDYLDTKRASFPRFFFISDDELLSVLGSSDPTSIQVHLLKLFDNVKEIAFGRNSKVVEGMSSVEKESFVMKTAVTVEGPVESWMLATGSAFFPLHIEYNRSILNAILYVFRGGDACDVTRNDQGGCLYLRQS